LIGVVQQYFQTRDARQYIALEDLEDLLLILRQRAVFVANRRMGKRSPDADDDWIIGIAIKNKADWLVSQNTQDLYQSLVTPSEKLLVLRISEALNLLETT
jgi:predicted nucleic acid-binding protein